jgi:hypothetical protein
MQLDSGGKYNIIIMIEAGCPAWEPLDFNFVTVLFILCVGLAIAL